MKYAIQVLTVLKLHPALAGTGQFLMLRHVQLALLESPTKAWSYSDSNEANTCVRRSTTNRTVQCFVVPLQSLSVRAAVPYVQTHE